jgi:hypothetical protein
MVAMIAPVLVNEARWSTATSSWAWRAGAALNRHWSPPTMVSAAPPEMVKKRTAGRR